MFSLSKLSNIMSKFENRKLTDFEISMFESFFSINKKEDDQEIKAFKVD